MLRKIYFWCSFCGGAFLALGVGLAVAGVVYSQMSDLAYTITSYGLGILTYVFCLLQYAFFIEYTKRKAVRKLLPEDIKPTLDFYSAYGDYLAIYRGLGKVMIVSPVNKQARLEPLSFIHNWTITEKLHNGKVYSRELTVFLHDFDFPSMTVIIGCTSRSVKKMQQFQYIM